MTLTTILWDWNGTLADDVQVALRSVNDILARRNRSPITTEDYYSYIDTPIRRFYEHLFSPLDDQLFDRILTEFNEGYRLHMKETGLMEGGAETLERFRKAGLRQIIVSSSQLGEVQHFCRLFGTESYFQQILGVSDFQAAGKVDMACRFLPRKNVPSLGTPCMTGTWQRPSAARCACWTGDIRDEKSWKPRESRCFIDWRTSGTFCSREFDKFFDFRYTVPV